jgi:hypothetical protein
MGSVPVSAQNRLIHLTDLVAKLCRKRDGALHFLNGRLVHCFVTASHCTKLANLSSDSLKLLGAGGPRLCLLPKTDEQTSGSTCRAIIGAAVCVRHGDSCGQGDLCSFEWAPLTQSGGHHGRRGIGQPVLLSNPGLQLISMCPSPGICNWCHWYGCDWCPFEPENLRFRVRVDRQRPGQWVAPGLRLGTCSGIAGDSSIVKAMKIAQ